MTASEPAVGAAAAEPAHAEDEADSRHFFSEELTMGGAVR
jgi:hypothetical protein